MSFIVVGWYILVGLISLGIILTIANKIRDKVLKRKYERKQKQH